MLASWLTAHGSGANQRERRVISLVGLSPDLDGLGWLLDQVNRMMGHPSSWYEEFHHVLGHNLIASVVAASLAAGLCGGRRVRVLVLALLVFHLHILCDVMGS